MVNADLHPNFQRLTPYEPLEELEVVYNIKMNLFEQIAEGPLRRVPWRVHGSLSNHGRDGKKEEVSAEMAYRRSYDVALYHQLERSLGVPFHIEQTYWGVEDVGGVRCLLHHGHLVHAGHAQHQLLPAKLDPAWAKARPPQTQGYWAGDNGHWHTAAEYQSNHFTFVSAGCTVGQDGYAYGMASCQNRPASPLSKLILKEGRWFRFIESSANASGKISASLYFLCLAASIRSSHSGFTFSG